MELFTFYEHISLVLKHVSHHKLNKQERMISYCIDVLFSLVLTGQCLASNGKCGTKGLTCEQKFGPGWINKGTCCHEKPCCEEEESTGKCLNKIPCCHVANNIEL